MFHTEALATDNCCRFNLKSAYTRLSGVNYNYVDLRMRFALAMLLYESGTICMFIMKRVLQQIYTISLTLLLKHRLLSHLLPTFE